ncbi:uncharacterized protein LOC131045463 isoform X2 [Cryptomeria japonica]|uniref:uncharacterized protein LOC131045463 isoform X2 n=1 Tax=Cryptomeria japonica TaxID=3369 RepID=UPI0027D9E7A6|nr:uncharacterized protein LOC131045463 isoform X2 [Cryptomeria japonica]
MASVAAAIEQAEAEAPKRVDESLWWDSFPSLLSLLQRPSPALLERLRKQHGCLLNLLSTFKLPNSNSRTAINCPRVIIGDHNIEIKPELKNVVVQLSSCLALDEVQMYILVSRSLELEAPCVTYEFESLFKRIAMQYFLERQCLLKCSHQVLVHRLSVESGSPEHDAITKEVNELLNSGLEDKLLAVLKELLSSEKQSSLDLQYVDMWAEETLIEENLILDILFLLYYEPFCICTVDRFKKLLSMFKEIITGCSNIGKLAVTQVAQKYAQVVKYQVILIVIEALNFENLLHMVYEGVPFSQGSHAFSLGDLQEIDDLISDIISSEAPEVGPIMFAWAIFICLVSMLTKTENQTRVEIDHSAYIRQAYERGAPNTILLMLQSEIFEDLNDQVVGYKSVLKTLISAFIAAYDIANQMDDNIVKFLLDLLCEIFSGQESLCLEFWDRESVIDGPIRSLLFTFRDNFPYQTLPMIRMLSSLCEGTWPAECVFDFLYRLSKITCLFQRRGFSYVNNDLQTVQAHISLQVPGASGLVIPAGTFGCVMKTVDEDVILVRWEALTLKLLELDSSVVVQTARCYGYMERTVEVDTVKIFCSLINNAVCLSNGFKVVALCTGILCKFFDCFPIQVASQIFSTLLFQSHTDISNSDGWLLPEAFTKLLSLDGDHSGGSYVFTISILDLFKTIITKGMQIDSVVILVVYIVRYILVNHGSWKYKFKHEPWEILSKVFSLMHVCIGSTLNKHPIELKHTLMEILLFDTTIHNIILHVLCVRAEFLEELYTSHFVSPKEIEWRQQAMYSALDLVGFAVIDVTFGDSSKDFPGPSALEQTLLHSTTPPVPFIIAAISLLGFFRNPALQLAAAKVLSSLCFVAQKTHSHAVSIASYVSSSKQRNNLNLVICRLLCAENALSNLELFSATLDLVTSAALYQPTFVEIMLFPQGRTVESSIMENNITTALSASSIKLEETMTVNGVDVVWSYIQNCEDLMNRQPYILSQILHFLKIHWQGGAECIHILHKLHNQHMFWKYISSSISKFPFSNITIDEALSKAFQYNCQSSVLHIMANEIFIQNHLVQAEKILTKRAAASSNNINNFTTGYDNKSMMSKSTGSSGALKVLLDWNENSVICRILQSYASCLYNKELLLDAKATACAFVVALIGKELVGDNRGLSLSLIKKIQLASKDLFEHPGFVELMEQYSTRGYSSERGLHALIVNDLYYHLQGELEGRQIPPGSFQKVSDYLVKLNLDSILQSSVHVRSQDLHPLYGDDYIYDTKSLEAELGMEWWSDSDEKGSIVAAQKMLQVLKHANVAFSLADSQKNALKAWMTLLTLTIFDKNTGTDVRTVMPDAILSETSIESCIKGLCDYLHTSMQLLGPVGDPTNHMPNFIIIQAQLLLIFVWWMYGCITSRKNGMQAWPLYARVIRTVITNLRVLMDTKPFVHDGIETIVRCLLAVLLISLELINSQNIEHNASRQSKSDMQNLGDAFADVSLMSLEFLPVLCNCVENDKFGNLSLAITDVLLKGFLAPHAWLPVLQKHFPTKLVICRIRHDKWQESAPVVLNLCLSLARVREGAEMLQSAGFFSCLSTFSQFVRNEISLSSGQTEGPFSLWNKWGLSDRLWGLGLVVITAMVMSVGENDAGVAVLCNALTYFISEKDYILCAIKAPDNLTDALGRKQTRNRMPQTSVIALQNTEHAITLMSQLAKNRVTRPDMMQYVDSEMRENIIHLLSFISKEAHLCSGDMPYKSMLLQCSHLQKEEIAALVNPSVVNCKSGWFSVAARGYVTKNRQSLSSQQTAPDPVKSIVPLSFTKGGAELDAIPLFCTEYSDMIALHVYRITLLILNFLCMQAQAAIKGVEEDGNVDLVHFPELPVPEIFHGLQDQAFNIVTELCSSRKQDPIEPQIQSVCLLLLRIMEQSLYLELCVTRICGISPVSVRLDDFSKEYKSLISDTQGKTFLEAPMKSIKRVVMLLYPSLS